MIAVDVGEDIGAARDSAEGYAVVIKDRGAIRAKFQCADIARRHTHAACGAGFLDAGVVAVVLVGFRGRATRDLDGLVLGIPGVGPSAAGREIAVRIVAIGIAADGRHRVRPNAIRWVGVGNAGFIQEGADRRLNPSSVLRPLRHVGS